MRSLEHAHSLPEVPSSPHRRTAKPPEEATLSEGVHPKPPDHFQCNLWDFRTYSYSPVIGIEKIPIPYSQRNRFD